MIHGSFESYRFGCAGNSIHHNFAKVNFEGFNIPPFGLISQMEPIDAECTIRPVSFMI